MPLKTQHDELPNLNLTSLIDVVFLLIVFFMAASKFADTERDVELRRLTLDGAAVTIGELKSRLVEERNRSPGDSVTILGDAGCAFQHVAAALAACKEAGVSDLAVSVRIAQDAAGARR